MAISHILGFPRIGPNRETKKAVEAFWGGKIDKDELLKRTAAVKAERTRIQSEKGLDLITVGDFTMYDHVLDLSVMLNSVPERFGTDRSDLLALTFEMGRGTKTKTLAMMKWFDTNYHYMVPEFQSDTTFSLNLEDNKLLKEISETVEQGFDIKKIKPVLVGPVTYLYLGKIEGADKDKIALLPQLLTQYAALLAKLNELGIEWVQLDEPLLGLECSDEWRVAVKEAYATLSKGALPKILLATYFSSIAPENVDLTVELPVNALHVDFARDLEKAKEFTKKLAGADKILSVGIVNGRNIWKNDLDASAAIIAEAAESVGKDKVWISSSCSLLHSPVDLDNEKKLDAEIKQWMAYAVQKVDEVVALTKNFNGKSAEVAEAFKASKAAVESKEKSTIVHNADVKKRMAAVTPEMFERKDKYPVRAAAQKGVLNLPPFPTTTIGSFPQTLDIRKTRRSFKSGKITEEEYNNKMKEEIKMMVGKQEEMGIDVLVHGEPERNDMVEYFGELLQGFAFSENGWVQSYGSRCVKPPIIYGDVWRKEPMTVDWISYAQSLTQKPMKAMLTGPVTILCWSFEREDISRKEQSFQIGLALRDEVADLEKAGIKVAQIDEPAFREGLPLQKSFYAEYLKWAVEAFKLSSGNAVENTFQIHTHMCYSDFGIIMRAVADMDADVITIETSRSHMKLLDAFKDFNYPNEIGPGVYDIHSPRIPEENEMYELMLKAKEKIDPTRLWVNPDCGLKTRKWAEVSPALERMMAVAKKLRTQ